MKHVFAQLVTDNRRRLLSLARRVLAPRWEADNELALTVRERGELERIYVAMRRIDSGVYGRCRGCSARIAIARLQDEPCALECDRCARREVGEGIAGSAA